MKAISPEHRNLKVFVYYNLHKRVWSVKALQGPQKGRILGHAESVFLASAHPKVSEAGRQRVIREQRKNVHAGVVGYLATWSSATYASILPMHRRVSYNPYAGPQFTYKDTGEVWEGSPWVLMAQKAVYIM